MDDQREALDFFLSDFQEGVGPHSPLTSAIRDARETMDHGKALWLATLGYLVTAEVVGRTIAKPNTLFWQRRGEWQAFRAGFLEFSDDPVADDARQAIWLLRCALAHHYELRNVDYLKKVHTFSLAEGGPLWAPPTQSTGFTHWVNVRAVAQYVEALVDGARRQHQAGAVVLLRDPQEVLGGGFIIQR